MIFNFCSGVQVLSIGKERLADIWELNHKFLTLFGNPDMCTAVGLSEELSIEVQKLSASQLEEVSRTDMLLFSVSEIPFGDKSQPLPDQLAEFYKQMSLTFRDISQEDLGVAASKLGLAKQDCLALLRLRLEDAQNYFVNKPPRFAPIGTTQFRVLTGLHNQSDRTQYALLAANDN